MTNVWKELPRPFFALAPMEGVTDSVFRRVMVKLGRPDVMFTEFIPVEGIAAKGIKTAGRSLVHLPEEKPLVAQIWGLDPELHYRAAKQLVEIGFDGVDINFGCPVRDVIKKGACSAMIKTPNLAIEIIKATQEGTAGKIPVSVKTRIGYDRIITEEWAGILLENNLDALTIHGRTTTELSLVPAHWEEIGKVVQLRNHMQVETVIIGNGDVLTVPQGQELAAQYGVDGVMIGRGVFQDPWLFNPTESIHNKTTEQKLAALLDHTHMFTDFWGTGKGFERLKRFVKIYISGFTGSAEIRDELMRTHGYQDFMTVLRQYT